MIQNMLLFIPDTINCFVLFVPLLAAKYEGCLPDPYLPTSTKSKACWMLLSPSCPLSVRTVQGWPRLEHHPRSDLERDVRGQPGLLPHLESPPVRLHLGLGHEVPVRLALLRFLRHVPHPRQLTTLLWHPIDWNVLFLWKEIVKWCD